MPAEPKRQPNFLKHWGFWKIRKRLPPYGKNPRKRVLKPPQREIFSNGHGGEREGGGRPEITLDPRAADLARFCRDHGWTIEAIAEGVGVCDKTLTRQVDLGPRGSHGKMQAHIWGEMFHCAMSRDQDKVHPALKAKSLIWLGDRLFPENVPPPEEGGGGTVINMVSIDQAVSMLIKATKCPKERRAIVNALDRLGDQEEAESGGDS